MNSSKLVKLLEISMIWAVVIIFFAGAYYLSSQNGIATFNLTNPFATKLANLLHNGKASAKQIYDINMMLRKAGHLGVYFLLSIVLCNAFCITNHLINHNVNMLLISIITLCILSAFAFYDEWHKQFIPGRHMTLSEAGLNIVGVVIGIVVMNGVRKLIMYFH